MLMLVTSIANATVVQYSTSFYTYTNANTVTTGSYAASGRATASNVSLQGFDSSLGTLTGVNISFTSRWDHTGSTSARDTSPEARRYYSRYRHCSWGRCHYHTRYYTRTYNDTSATNYADSRLTVTLLDPAGAASSRSSTLRSSCRSSVSSSVASCSDTDRTIQSFNGSLNLTGIDLNDFVKTSGDLVDLRMSNFKGARLYCDNNDAGDRCYGNSYGRWNGRVNISYTYTATAPTVPEPAALGLFGLGLLGLGFVRRKKQA